MKILLLLMGAVMAAAQTTAPQAAAQAPKKIRVAGTVLALNGEPVRRGTVRLQAGGPVQNGQPPTSYSESTGNDGKFAFEDVTPGRYTLSSEKAGFITTRYGARSNNAAGIALILTAGQELKDVTIQMTPQGIITGHVTDLDGDPVPNAIVYLQRYTYNRGHRQLSSFAANQANDQGDFRMASLAPGRYYAYARDNRALTTSQTRASAQEVNVQTYYPNALEASGAAPLDVPAGGEIQGINIQLRKGRVYAIRGKILDPSSGTIPGGIPVDLASKDNANGTSNLSRFATRPADGGFEFRNLSSGTYVLRAMPGNMRDANGQSRPSPYTGRVEVTIADSSLEDVVLPLTRGFEIEGTVKLEDGDLKKLITPPTPASGTAGAAPTVAALSAAVILADGALISLGGGQGRLSIQLTEADGGSLFSLPVPAVKEDGTFRMQGAAASTYLLNVGGLPDGTYVKSVKFGGRDVTRLPIELGGGGSLAIVLSAKAGSVSGSVRNEKGEPLGGYQVSIWPKIPELGSPSGGIKTATTDLNGAFKFPSLAPGDYFAAAWDDLDQGLALSGEFLAHFNGGASAIKLAESGQATIDVKVIPRERIAAEVAKLE